MWKFPQHVKGGVGSNDSKFYDKPTQRRRWDSISDPKLLPSHFEYSPPRSIRWDASTQVPSEHKLQQRSIAHSEYNYMSSSRPTCWNVGTQVPSQSKLQTSYIMKYIPSRIAGGNGCNCCPCPPPSCERPVESCLPGLHQKYVDIYDSKKCIEGHLPAGYRSFVEHDDLYLPPSRPLSPASTDHDDLYLPLRTCDEYSPRCPCPNDLRMCDSDPTYGDIYLPPSRPCTPAFPKDPCGYPPPCNPCCPPPPCNPCCPPPPCKPCPPPPCPPPSNTCGKKIQCHCPPYIKKLAPCPAPSPPSNDCSCPPYVKKQPGCSTSPSPSPPCSPSRSRIVKQCSSVYIDEVPSPPLGNRYVACQECLCHKDISTQSLCPPPRKISPCRDCVCHLGSRSPSQGGIICPSKNHTQCQAGFQTPGKTRLKLHLNQSQCLECKSPYSCKGPSNCNPQYIVESPLSPSLARSRSPSPCVRSKSPKRGGNYSTQSPAMSSRCQACDCHKSQGSCSGPPKVNPKLFADPCCSPCKPVIPCRPLLAAEMLSGIEACASQAKACGVSASSCTTCDPRCSTCECHKSKCPPSPPPCRPPSPPPCNPCNNKPPSNSSCRSPPPCSPCRPTCGDDDVHNPTFKTFQSTSPRCKDCNCHKPKNCKLSSQICKFCRRAGWCYCEYHTTQQLLLSSEQSSSQRDNFMEVEETMVSHIPKVPLENKNQGDCEILTQSSKVELHSPCDGDIESTSRILDKDMAMQSDITQLCCCGKCEYTKPRFPIRTECPFCKHTHSCCCGMCTCPIPSCSSKTPLAADGLTPRLSLNSSGASTGRNNFLLPYRSNSISQAPRKKLGFTSPEKSSSKSFSTSNLQLSSARLCNSSPKSREKFSMQKSPTRR